MAPGFDVQSDQQGIQGFGKSFNYTGAVSPRTITYFMCSYLGLTVLGFHGTAALLPHFIDSWQLSATEAGWSLGVMSLCALLATPAIALTDRVDARSVMVVGTLVNVLGYAGFGLFAEGLYSAMFFRGLMGVGFALSYMPGLKAIADRMGAEEQTRAASIYVSSFSICSALSIAIAGFGRRRIWLALGLCGTGLLESACRHAVAVVSGAVEGGCRLARVDAQGKPAHAPALLDFRPIIANRGGAWICHRRICSFR